MMGAGGCRPAGTRWRGVALVIAAVAVPWSPWFVGTADGQEDEDLVGDDVAGVVIREEEQPLAPSVRELADGGVAHHLGGGTAEDVHVHLGAGAHLSVLSGNLSLRIVPMPRGDLPPEVQLAFTYNSLDREQPDELGRGWSLDILRRIHAGAFGERVLVDADGFRDAFFAGEQPGEDEVRRLGDRLVAAWRVRTPLPQRRAVGGEDALRTLIASDPLALADLRERLLGPAAEAGASFRSDLRAPRVLERTDKGWTLRSTFGRRERYDTEGRFFSWATDGGPQGEVLRDSGRLRGFRWARDQLWTFSTDGQGRISSVDESSGRALRLQWLGPVLHTMESDGGRWSFTWDERGQLRALTGPQGSLDIAYDDLSGRVSRVRGPRGDHTLRVEEGLDGGVAAVLSGSVGTHGWTWDERRRTRTRTDATGTERVVFEARRPLPTLVETPEGTMRLRWSAGATLLDATTGTATLRAERGAQGKLAAVDVAGRRFSVTGEGQVLSLRDGAGRVQRVRGVGALAAGSWAEEGGLESRWTRNYAGAIDSTGGEGRPRIDVQCDGFGWPRTVTSDAVGSAAGRYDALGRLRAIDLPGVGEVELRRAATGELMSIEGGGASVRVHRDAAGQIAGWDGGTAPMQWVRDGQGRVVRLDALGRGVSTLTWGQGGLVRLDHPVYGTLEVRRDGRGRIEQLGRVGGGNTRFGYDDRGRVSRIIDDAWGELAVRRGPSTRVDEIDLGGGTWRVLRDGAGRTTAIVGPDGVPHHVQLDSSGRAIRVAPPELAGIDLSIDAAGRPIRVAYEDRVLSLRRDALGRVVEAEGPDGRRLRLRWARAGELDEVRFGEGAPEEPGAAPHPADGDRLDGAGWPVVHGGEGHIWSRGHLHSHQRGGTFASVERDSASRIVAVWDRGRTWRMLPDVLGDPRSVEWREGGATGSWVAERDLSRRLSAITGPAFGAVSIRRDRSGRPTRIERGDTALVWTWIDREHSADDSVAAALGVSTARTARGALGSVEAALWSHGRLVHGWTWLEGEGAGIVSKTWADSGPEVEAVPPPVLEAPSAWGAGAAADVAGRIAVPLDGRVLLWIDSAGRWGGLSPPGGPPPGYKPAAQPPSAGRDTGPALVLERWAAADELVEPPALLAAVDPPVGAEVAAGRTGIRGVGALVPPLPGANRLVPLPPLEAALDLPSLLVALGDAHPDFAIAAGAVADGPTIVVPGGPWLLDIAARLASPSAPLADRTPALRIDPTLRGLSTSSGRGHRTLAPLIEDVPAGVVDLLPGADAEPSFVQSFPRDGRATALDALADGPFGGRDSMRRLTEEQRWLALAAAWSTPLSRPFASLQPTVVPGERWVVELVPGLRVELDAWGEIVAVDAGVRELHAAWRHVESRAAAWATGRDQGSARRFAPPCVPWLGGPPEAQAGYQAPPGRSVDSCGAH